MIYHNQDSASQVHGQLKVSGGFLFMSRPEKTEPVVGLNVLLGFIRL